MSDSKSTEEKTMEQKLSLVLDDLMERCDKGDLSGKSHDKAFDDVKHLFDQELTKRVEEACNFVIGGDYPKVTRRYSGGIWLGDTQLNWTDVERARRHFQSRNAEKAEQRERLASLTNQTNKGEE